jgi:hypothetical protein
MNKGGVSAVQDGGVLDLATYAKLHPPFYADFRFQVARLKN